MSLNYFNDIVLTKSSALWTDERAYNNIQEAINAIGPSEQTLLISRPITCTDLTIPPNISLYFTDSGSISNSGTLTIQTRNIISGDHQIFSGSGPIVFPVGIEVRSTWFADLQTAITATQSSTLTLVIANNHSVTASCSVGDNVVLKWDSPNVIEIPPGITISNISNIIAGNYKIFEGSGIANFIAGTVIKSAWFPDLRLALISQNSNKSKIWLTKDDSLTSDFTEDLSGIDLVVKKGKILTLNGISTINFNIVVEDGGQVLLDQDCAVNGNIRSEGNTSGVVAFDAVTGDETLTINGSIDAGLWQVFGDSLSVAGSFRVNEIYIQWFGGKTNENIDNALIKIFSFCDGHTIRIPAGYYYSTTPDINIDKTCLIKGDGWSTYSQDNSGTIIQVDWDSTPINGGYYITGSHVQFENIEWRTTQPTIGPGWTPNFPNSSLLYCFRDNYLKGGRKLTIKNCLIRNFSRAVRCQGADQLDIDGLWGQWFVRGVHINGSYDVARVKRVHCWPGFWSGDSNVIDYMNSNLVLIMSGRNDNPVFEEIFANHLRIGFSFYESKDLAENGTTSRCQITNYGLDFCEYGFVSDTTTSGHSVCATNGYISGNSRTGGAIYLNGKYDYFMFSNLDVHKIAGYILSIHGTHAVCEVANLNVRSWNESGSTIPAFRSYGGSIIKLSDILIDPSDGNGADLYFIDSNGGKVLGNFNKDVPAKLEYLFKGSVDSSGNATIDTSTKCPYNLHTKCILMQGMVAKASNGLPYILDASQMFISGNSQITINTPEPEGQPYWVYIVIVPAGNR